ncbi:MAG: phosphoserine phosphatase [Methanomassiliicoccales archaeon]
MTERESDLLETGELSIEDIEEKRDLLNIEAEKHRRSRDELNEKSREYADLRDKLNAQARELIESASEHRRKRDDLNEKVKEAKEQREVWNKKYSDLAADLVDLRRNMGPRNGTPTSKLKRDLKALEFKQMTSVLSPEKEKELVEQMSKIQQEIKRREESLKSNTQYADLLNKVNEAKENAEKYHRLVSELADEAQREHEEMASLYDKADEIRKEADAAQAKFVETKLQADEEHRKHIEAIHQVHDFDKILYGLRQKQRRPGRGMDAEKIAKDAEQVFERFKKGEKLSTEDLMLLQKSGYL